MVFPMNFLVLFRSNLGGYRQHGPSIITLLYIFAIAIFLTQLWTLHTYFARTGNEPAAFQRTKIYGHVHIAKTAGTSLNGVLANKYERICGHKGYSYNAYQANERAKVKAAIGARIFVTGNAPASPDRVPNRNMIEMGFEDCDWISHETDWNFWVNNFGNKRFHNLEMELHVPCRDPIDHLMSMCNHKRSWGIIKGVLSCDDPGDEKFTKAIDDCIVFVSERFHFELGIHFNLKCYEYEKQFSTYMEMMGSKLQKRRIVSEPYIPRESNLARDKTNECIWKNDAARERANQYLIEKFDYYKFCNACIGSDDDLTMDSTDDSLPVKNDENKKENAPKALQSKVKSMVVMLETVSSKMNELKTHLNNESNSADKRRSETKRTVGGVQHSSIEKSFCFDWSPSDALNRTMQPFDEWWTHNPHWFIENETDTEFCVKQGDLQNDRVKEFLRFYATQFYSSCQKVNWRGHWNSGWGATFLNMEAGLIDSADYLHIPLTMGFQTADRSRWYWNYAANKHDGSNKTCPTADTDCYFLPHHNCGTHEEIYTGSTGIERIKSKNLPPGYKIGESDDKAMIAYKFMTRKQLWLRRAVYDFKKEFRSSVSESDCTVIHVRRGDVVLDKTTRRYFPVKAYVDLVPKDKINDPNHSLFLLTDDANAIEEALEFYPDLRWKYFKRERLRGSSTGFEGHTPSLDPASEVITILATFDLVQDCSALVSGQSNYALYIWVHMRGSPRRDELKQFRVDKGTAVYSTVYNTSEIELNAFLEEMRKNKTRADMTFNANGNKFVMS